jgi:hypothetical protein
MPKAGVCAIVLALFAIVYWRQSQETFNRPDGVLVKEAPIQGEPKRRSWQEGENYFTPLAYFELRARVISTNWFWFDREKELSPVDLLLAWGAMSDSRNLRKLKIGHSARFYGFSVKQDIDPASVMRQMSNVHIVPASQKLKEKLRLVKVDDIIRLVGHLVKITRQDGWSWSSSTSREDTGSGSCELVYLEEFQFD